MDDQTALQRMARIFAEEAGRNNALAATLVGMLSALRQTLRQEPQERRQRRRSDL